MKLFHSHRVISQLGPLFRLVALAEFGERKYQFEVRCVNGWETAKTTEDVGDIAHILIQAGAAPDYPQALTMLRG